MPEPLLQEQSQGVLTLTLNRPEALNALTTELLRALSAALKAAGKDKAVRGGHGAGVLFRAGLKGVRWDAGFARFAEVIRNNPSGRAAQCAYRLAELHREIISMLPPSGRALVISHGGIVEASAIGCKPDENYDVWGLSCSYLEGVRLYFAGTVCERVELLRVKG